MDIVVDLDGTIADITHRLHYISKDKPRKERSWKKFFEACDKDKPIQPILDIITCLYSVGYYCQINRIIFASGRSDEVKGKTIEWLDANFGYTYEKLYMRKAGDYRADYIVKEEILDQMIADGYNPTIAIDDRKQCVDLWRRRGLTCLQVADGDF